jgi:hypothetical protein
MYKILAVIGLIVGIASAHNNEWACVGLIIALVALFTL